MPTTFVGLVLFVVFLVPGYVYSIERRSRLPSRPLSSLSETVGLVFVSVVTNAVAALVFGALRALLSRHTPDVGRWIRTGSAYAEPRIAYLAAWCGALLLLSCALAFLIGLTSGRKGPSRLLNPVILDVSTWYHVFEHPAPASEGRRTYAYVGCTLDDGSYVGGRLSWYSTEVVESADRELALSEPIEVRDPDGVTIDEEASVVIVSARSLRRLSVTWVEEDATASG